MILDRLTLAGVFFIALALSATSMAAEGSRAKEADPRVKVSGGMYSPLFREPEEGDRRIATFFLDKYPVSRSQFQDFLKANPRFLPETVPARLADTNYLEGWKNGQPPVGTEAWPVTSVSWFAARAFCQAKGGRLPRVDEWEFAARAEKKENLQQILEWYAQPADTLKPATSLRQDSETGLVGMHGLVWEWVEDFSSVIVQGDSRSTNDTEKDLFCGAGAMKAKRPEEYATFMRFAFRSSLKAKSAARSLGFRCAYDELNRATQSI